MNSLRDIIILMFLLGSPTIGFASHAAAQTGYNYNENHSQDATGLERILNAIHAPDSISYGHSQSFGITKPSNHGPPGNAGYSYTPNSQQGTSSYNNGYQYAPPNNGNGYHYENPSSMAQIANPPLYLDNNKNTDGLSIGYLLSGAHKLPNPVKESHRVGLNQGQSPNLDYHFDAPAQHYYGNTQTASGGAGYNYNKPKQSSNKGNLHISSGLSLSHNNYQYEQKQGVQGHTTAMAGYQYQSPEHSGYGYYKPQKSEGTESNFKGQSYLPTPSTLTPISNSYLGGNSNPGYSYDKPAAPFKEESYLPMPESRW